MELVHQVASPAELEEILEFARSRLNGAGIDPMERQFAEWGAPWRREALEHYLKLGWSFTARRGAGGEIAGFFIGQPFLFMRGQTQTLWIEHLDAVDEAAREGLADVAVRLAREKHLQRVLFSAAAAVPDVLAVAPASRIEEAIMEVRTTKG